MRIVAIHVRMQCHESRISNQFDCILVEGWSEKIYSCIFANRSGTLSGGITYLHASCMQPQQDVLGAISSIEEFVEASLFFYLGRPQRYVKIQLNKSSEPSLTGNDNGLWTLKVFRYRGRSRGNARFVGRPRLETSESILVRFRVANLVRFAAGSICRGHVMFVGLPRVT